MVVSRGQEWCGSFLETWDLHHQDKAADGEGCWKPKDGKDLFGRRRLEAGRQDFCWVSLNFPIS